MNEVDRDRYAALAASIFELEPDDLDDLMLNALNTSTGMLRLMTGDTLAKFDGEGRLLAIAALCDVAQDQLNRVRAAVAAELMVKPRE